MMADELRQKSFANEPSADADSHPRKRIPSSASPMNRLKKVSGGRSATICRQRSGNPLSGAAEVNGIGKGCARSEALAQGAVTNPGSAPSATPTAAAPAPAGTAKPLQAGKVGSVFAGSRGCS